MVQSIEAAGTSIDQAMINKYFGQARNIVKEWEAKLDAMPVTKPGWLFSRYWRGYNKLNSIE